MSSPVAVRFRQTGPPWPCCVLLAGTERNKQRDERRQRHLATEDLLLEPSPSGPTAPHQVWFMPLFLSPAFLCGRCPLTSRLEFKVTWVCPHGSQLASLFILRCATEAQGWVRPHSLGLGWWPSSGALPAGLRSLSSHPESQVSRHRKACSRRAQVVQSKGRGRTDPQHPSRETHWTCPQPRGHASGAPSVSGTERGSDLVGTHHEIRTWFFEGFSGSPVGCS